MNYRHKAILYISIACIVSSSIITSCRVTKDYVKPQFNVPSAFHLPDSAVHQADSVLLSWKDFFNDTTLVALVDSAVRLNFDMRNALKSIDIANQYYKQSRALYLPDIDLNAPGVIKQFRSKNYYSGPSSGWYDRTDAKAPENMYLYQSQFINSVEVGWEIDIWGKIKRQKEEAMAKYLETYEAKKAIQTSLVADIAENYYLLLMLDEQLEVAQRNYELRNNTLKMVELQYQSGDVTALAVQQTKSQVLEASALIPKLKKDIAIHENALRMLTGNLSTSLERKSHLSEIQPADSLLELPLYLMQNRPDVLAAEYDLKAANANVGVTQAYRYPNINIDITGGVNSMLPKNWVSIPGSLFGGIVGGIATPLLNKRKLKTNYEVAKLERDKAEIDFQETVYNAIIETQDARISIEQTEKQLAIAEEQVDVAQNAVRSAALLFRAGFATYLEVITAQSHELETELNLASLKADLLTARVQLYRALGGGWK